MTGQAPDSNETDDVLLRQERSKADSLRMGRRGDRDACAVCVCCVCTCVVVCVCVCVCIAVLVRVAADGDGTPHTQQLTTAALCSRTNRRAGAGARGAADQVVTLHARARPAGPRDNVGYAPSDLFAMEY